MINPNRIVSDNLFSGDNQFLGDVLLPDEIIEDKHIEADAEIASTKLQHRHVQPYGQNGNNVDATQFIHHAKGAGTVKTFVAGSIGICTGGNSTTVDLKKNGTTVLSAVITLDSANTTYVAESGTIATAAYVAGDVFTVVVDKTSDSGDATGLFACAEFDEAAV